MKRREKEKIKEMENYQQKCKLENAKIIKRRERKNQTKEKRRKEKQISKKWKKKKNYQQKYKHKWEIQSL